MIEREFSFPINEPSTQRRAQAGAQMQTGAESAPMRVRRASNLTPEQKEERRVLRKKKRMIRRCKLAAFLAVCALVSASAITGVAAGVAFVAEKIEALSGSPEYLQAAYDMSQYEFDADDARLLLVNSNVLLDELYTVSLATADDATGVKLEEETAAAYRAMALAANGDGVSLVLQTGYLDATARAALYEACVQDYVDDGYTLEQAQARAQTVVGTADANEHGTGYAADIVSSEYSSLDVGFAETDAYLWLVCYAADYGFVLRYPEDRQMITGMAYQPWHWRYVGVENAKAIAEDGVSLEEFLEGN